MTDSPAASSPPAAAPPPQPRPQGRSRVRLWVTLGIIGGLVALLACAGTAALVVGRLVDRLERTGEGAARAHDACVTLETRLNRLTPPGATNGPAARATAIRDENGAVRLFLVEIEQLRDDWQIGTDGDRDDWLGWWRGLLEARTAYAEALTRQVRTNEPAFFVAPRTRHGGSTLDRLGWLAPDACRGPVRRLAAPDL
ncbi:MAG TPA: hypothetical protein VFB84_00050 [Micromonosporaceae bacterium]|nr:hypothetical protein [Micromonosporaceae bacterium]